MCMSLCVLKNRYDGTIVRWYKILFMKYYKKYILLLILLLSASCSQSSGQFTAWQDEQFAATKITESTTKTFTLANSSGDSEQHIRAIAFDRGSNSAGHFRIDKLEVSGQAVSPADIVVPPGSSLMVTVTYSPMNLDITQASYGGWVTGEPERWIPKKPEEVNKTEEKDIIQRAIIEAVYDKPGEGIYYVQLIGEAMPGPNGEDQGGGAFAACTPGNGIACYTGGFAVDIPDLAPGGPKALELTGPMRFNISGGTAKLRMDDFPYALMVLRSEEVPKLPSNVTATLVISGAQGVEANGTFDGARLSLSGVSFRIRVALGELTVDQVKQGISALVDFNLPDLKIETTKPFAQGAITLHLETKLPENPSGNELFDQFLSGVKITAIMEGQLAF